MTNASPPFRADHVGSILRSAALKDARAKHEKGEITDGEFKKIEDAEVEKIIRKQEEIGLKLATDGEFRRAWWHFDFMSMLTGAELYSAEQGIQFRGTLTKAKDIRVVGKIDFPADHPFLDDFKFVKQHTRVTPKITIPGPPVMHFRLSRDTIDRKVYPDIEEYFDDLAKCYAKAVKAFYDAGCRYLQLDDTVWAYLCSQDELQKARGRGWDVDTLPTAYARIINAVIAARPADMAITTHVCRGNFRSTWIAEGGYEPVGEVLFGTVKYDGFFLEYDSDRAGGFEPLRFLPKGKQRAVLGLLTSKFGKLESKDDLKRRIDEATKYVALDQICLSPQCGFASTEEGNILTEDEQWAKLRRCVELADEIWGGC